MCEYVYTKWSTVINRNIVSIEQKTEIGKYNLIIFKESHKLVKVKHILDNSKNLPDLIFQEFDLVTMF